MWLHPVLHLFLCLQEVKHEGRVACVNVTSVRSPQYRMQHEAVGLVQALNNSVFEGAIQSGHVNLFLIAVIAGPEEIT